jgi:hypothetical protein
MAVQQGRDLGGGKPCADSSTITARLAGRHRPRRSAFSCSISLPEPLASTLTGRILITTSPAGGCCGNFDPAPGQADVNALQLPVSRRGYAQNFWIGVLGDPRAELISGQCWWTTMPRTFLPASRSS